MSVWCLLAPIVVFSQEPPPLVTFSVSEFIVEGDNQLSVADTERILGVFIGEHTGLDRLLEAANALESAHVESGYSFHRVTLPPQTMAAGAVHLKVIVFTLGNVRVIGNQHFSDEAILRSLPALQQSGPPNTRNIARALSLANRHPSRQHVINLKNGSQADTIDAEVRVEDQKPWLLFGGLNNMSYCQKWCSGG